MLAAHDRRRLLHFVIDDPASTTVESTEALRVLGEMTGQPARSHRRGRNANVPLTQADIDADLEQALTFRNNDGLRKLLRRHLNRKPRRLDQRHRFRILHRVRRHNFRIRRHHRRKSKRFARFHHSVVALDTLVVGRA